MHGLQHKFASEAGEAAWNAQMQALFAAGALDEAEAQLAEAIALHEGEPVTGVTIAIANEADRAFEKGALHRPHVLLGIYTDEAYAFSSAVHWQLLDECQADEPAWAGREEDIEVHMAIEGLDGLNTRLLHHKQRHFFRDGQEAPAPLRYVEFVLGCWWRALRWHQAVAAASATTGLPRGVPVIAGMVDMRPEAVAIHATTNARARPTLQLVGGRDLDTASIGDGLIQRRPVEDEGIASPATVTALRRRMQAEDVAVQPPAGGFLARFFGRR